MRIRMLVAALATTTAATAAPLQLYTEHNPPFNYAEGSEVKGIATNAVREMLRKAGLEATITLLKWDEAYAKAQSTAGACVFGTARLANRENVFKWYGPVAQNTWGLYALPSFSKKLAKAGDARFYKVGGVKNDAKVDFLRAEGASSIKEAATDAENPARLMKAKDDPDYIELWITTSATAKEVAAAAGVKDLKELLLVRKQALYLACNPRTAKADLAKLEAAARK
jgi:polar amino acid transport system substrate-binding protein